MDCVKNRDGLVMIDDAFGTHRRESSASWACAVRRRLRRFRCARAMRGDDDAREGSIERIGIGRARGGRILFGLRSIIAVQRRA